MVNSSVIIGATLTMAAVISAFVLFSLENTGSVKMSNSEPLGAKSKWLLKWPKQRLQQMWTVDLSGVSSGGAPVMMVETVESEWKMTMFFAEKKMTSFEGVSPAKAVSMCEFAMEDANDFASCMAVFDEKFENCQVMDADLSHMDGSANVNKPIENGIRRSRRRALQTMSLNSRRLQTDEQLAELEADLATSGLSEAEKQAVRDCVSSGSSECEDSVADDHETPFEDEEEEVDEILPVTLENGEVVENAIIIGSYLVQLDDDSVPINIISGGDGSVLAEVVSILPLDENDEARLAGDWSCEGEERRALQDERRKERLTRRLGEEEARKLFEADSEAEVKRNLQSSDSLEGFDGVTYYGKNIGQQMDIIDGNVWTLEADVLVQGAGDCGGPEIRMYEGNGDNPGTTPTEKKNACRDACLNSQTPLSGSWDGFTAKGFIVYPPNGRCFCEQNEAVPFQGCGGGYLRYDLIEGRSAVSVSPYGWCGAGTQVDGSTPCPNDGDVLQYACRRHDLGKNGHEIVLNNVAMTELAIAGMATMAAAVPLAAYATLGVFGGAAASSVASAGLGGAGMIGGVFSLVVALASNTEGPLLSTVGRSCGQDYDLWKTFKDTCPGNDNDPDICRQKDSVTGEITLSWMMDLVYGKDTSYSGLLLGCNDKAITAASSNSLVYGTVTTGHNGNAHWHNYGNHCHGGWQSCGWRGCNWNGCKSSHSNHNQEHHGGHTANVIKGVGFNIVERQFFGSTRYECSYSNSAGVSTYDHNSMLFEYAQNNAAMTIGNLMTWASTGIALGDIGAFDYKPACYSHYRNMDGDLASSSTNEWGQVTEHQTNDWDFQAGFMGGGFILAWDHAANGGGGAYKNSATNWDYGDLHVGNHQKTYHHYDTPHFHNYGYNHGDPDIWTDCEHTNSDGSTVGCTVGGAFKCPQDGNYFTACLYFNSYSFDPSYPGAQGDQCNTW